MKTKLSLKRYKKFYIPSFIKKEDGSIDIEECIPVHYLNYGTSDKNCKSEVIALSLAVSINQKWFDLQIPFVWEEFLKLDLDTANQVLHKRIKEYIDNFYIGIKNGELICIETDDDIFTVKQIEKRIIDNGNK